jgi:ABC-type uncharacterized transport system substrate-binding protein
MAARKRRLIVTLSGLCVLLVVLVLVLNGHYKKSYSVTPTTNGGTKWRLAYYEGGEFFDYALHLRVIVNGLAKLGWIEPVTFPEFDNPDDTSLIWAYLAEHVQSDFIEFVPDAYWSAHWDETLREQNRTEALHQLAETGNIDLMIAMGTWAGLDLANNEHHIPTVVVNASDAVKAGIIKSAEDSGFDHVHAWVDPDQYVRQVRLFHDIVGFKRLGVAYEDTPEGRTYANLSDLQKVARERGFEVVGCLALDAIPPDEARLEIARCFEELAPRVDAMWLGAHNGIHAKYMPEQLEVLMEHGVVTWSQAGAEHVRRGVVISIARKELDSLGLWTAEVIARILNGARPRDLNQVFEIPNAILINLEAARRTHFDPPPSILEVADEVYQTIETD